MEIDTPHFYMRPLTVSDATETYLGWFSDTSTQKYIVSAAQQVTLENLKKYISEKLSKNNVLFWGIFDKKNGKHIGNIKFEPIDSTAGYAVMGMLIGDPEYRGRGVAATSIKATAAWLKAHRNIHQILLGVHVHNMPAIKAYESIGFRIGNSAILKSESPENLVMIWNL